MKKHLFILCILFSFNSFSQKVDTTTVHFTGSYSNGLCGLLLNDHSQNAYFNKVYTMISIGARKDFYEEKVFGELLFNYYDRGTRYSVAAGNAFFSPDLRNVYHNHYLAIQASFGFYLKRSIYLKEALSFDFLLASDQYNVKSMRSFRGMYRFTPSFESSIGFDFSLGTIINGYFEWFAGVTFLKPYYIYSGPRIGFYFREKEIMPGKY